MATDDKARADAMPEEVAGEELADDAFEAVPPPPPDDSDEAPAAPELEALSVDELADDALVLEAEAESLLARVSELSDDAPVPPPPPVDEPSVDAPPPAPDDALAAWVDDDADIALADEPEPPAPELVAAPEAGELAEAASEPEIQPEIEAELEPAPPPIPPAEEDVDAAALDALADEDAEIAVADDEEPAALPHDEAEGAAIDEPPAPSREAEIAPEPELDALARDDAEIAVADDEPPPPARDAEIAPELDALARDDAEIAVADDEPPAPAREAEIAPEPELDALARDEAEIAVADDEPPAPARDAEIAPAPELDALARDEAEIAVADDEPPAPARDAEIAPEPELDALARDVAAFEEPAAPAMTVDDWAESVDAQEDVPDPVAELPRLHRVADDEAPPTTTPPVARPAPALHLAAAEEFADEPLDDGLLPDDTSLETLGEMPMPEPRPERAPELGRRKLQLGEMLVESGAIKSDQLEMALAEQRRTKNLLGEVLVSLGFAEEDAVAQAVSKQTGIPYANVPKDPLPPQLLKIIPEDVARRHRLVALGVEGSILKLAMANPFDVVALDQIRSSTGLVPLPSIASWGQIVAAIERNFAARESFDETFERLIAAAEARVGADIDEDVTRGPLVELVDQLIVRAVEERATDIHIEPEELVIRIRYRIDSILQPGPMIPKKLQPGIAARIKVMAELNIAENRVPQDGRIRFAIKGRQIDLRVSTFLCNYGENIVLRVLDKASVVLSLDKVGFMEDDLEKFNRLIEKPHGIVLVTGPTGSGKTTTLYAALSKLNTIDVNIMTIEDPIEYELNLIRQSQVNLKAGITFASGLRALLRQDPDIILIGEMRDEETASMAVRAAMTGHLVFSTLHTNTAAGAVSRIVDMKVEPLLVTDTVIAAIGQRLSRLVCPKCRELVPAPAERKAELEASAEREGVEWDGLVAVPKGCPACRFRGYHGRAALFEIFEMTREAQDLVLHRQYGAELVRLARSQGMRTMYDDGLRRVLMHTHTLDEIDRVIDHDIRAESAIADG